MFYCLSKCPFFYEAKVQNILNGQRFNLIYYSNNRGQTDKDQPLFLPQIQNFFYCSAGFETYLSISIDSFMEPVDVSIVSDSIFSSSSSKNQLISCCSVIDSAEILFTCFL